MIVKPDPAYDTSHWKEVPNFADVEPRPVLVFTKATECYPGAPFNNTTDPTFEPYFKDLDQDGILRGAFHFSRKAYSPIRQATHFIRVIAPLLKPNDILALDLEEGGETAAYIITWLDAVEAVLSNEIWIYGRKNLLDPIPMTAREAERLKKYPTWIAGYPTFPDLFSAIPSWYVPNQNKWGPVAMWQYTDKGRVTGIPGNVDCNWIAPWMLEKLKQIPVPQPEPEEPMPLQLGTINTTERYIRNGPGVSNTHIAMLYRDDIVTIDREQIVGGFKWYHIIDARRGGGSWQKVITLGGLNVDQRNDCWIYGESVILSPVEPTPTPEPVSITGATIHLSDGTSKEMVIKP